MYLQQLFPRENLRSFRLPRAPRVALAGLTSLLLATLPARAQLYWDANGVTAGAGVMPAGIWGTDAFWSADPLGLLAPGAWVPGSTAVFSAGSDATGAFTVTVSGTQTAGGMVIDEGTVTIAGGAVSIGGGPVTVNAGATLSTDSSLRISATAGSTMTINGGTVRTTNPSANGSFVDIDQVIVLGPGGGTLAHVTTNILNIVQTTTIISGSGALTKTGIGVLAISSPCTYAGGTIINEGELRIRGAAHRLPTNTAVTVNSPGILNLNTVVSGVGQQIGSLSGNGDVGLGGSTLMVGDANNTVFSGSIRDIANYGAGATTTTGGRVSKQGAGTLTLAGVNTFTGRYTNDAGTLTVNPGATWCGSICDVFLNAGTINLNNAAQTIENLVGAAASTINLGTGHVLTTDPAASTTFSGTLAGPGGLTKANVVSGTTMRTLTLNGANTYDGPTTVSGGKIAVGSATALGSAVGGTTVASGAEILFDGASIIFTINEPFTIAGPGAGEGGAITVQNSANVTLSGPVTLAGDTTNTVSGTGTVVYNNPAAFTSLANQNLTLQGGASSTGGGGTISGVISLGTGGLTKQQGGRWILSAANNYSGPTLVSAGNLRIANTTGSATGSGAVTVNAGATLSGPGSIAGDLTLNGTLAPGASPGTMNTASQIWNGGASYVWEVNDATGTQGADPGWDHVNITGTLTINATPGSKFNINVASLTLANSPGLAVNFDGLNNDYVWTILTASGGITGFDPAAFNVTTSSFSNPLATRGTFLVEQSGNNLQIRYVRLPTVTTPPMDQLVACPSPVMLSVVAAGTAPLSYQWRKGGVNLSDGGAISGATTASLAISPPSPLNNGNYDVVVSNPYGSITSAVAVVTVTDSIPPTIACPGNLTNKTTSASGGVITFAPSASDTCGAAPTVVCVPPSGSTFPTGTSPVDCTATDGGGNTSSCSFMVTVFVQDSTNYVVNAAIPDNDALGLTSAKTVSSPINYLTDVNVALDITGTFNGDLFAKLTHSSGSSVLVNRVGRRVAAPRGYDDDGLNITLDDQATNGNVHIYRLTLNGDHANALGGPLTNRWAPDGRTNDPSQVLDTDLLDPNSLLSSFNGLDPNGTWTLFVSDVESGDNSTLVGWGLELCGLVKPTITVPPANVLTYAASNASFSVTAAGSVPFSYQWRHAGTNLPGATSATLNLSNVSASNEGSYDVVVSNAAGSVTSPAALLTLQRDFGDAPDPTYPTLLANNGARHVVVPGFFLGAAIDAEGNGQPTVTADGDDVNGAPDDEDGLTGSSGLVPGQMGSMTVVASAPGILNAWIDFSANGSWANAGEHVAVDMAVVAGPNTVNFPVPLTAVLGSTVARLRFASVGGLSFTGDAPDGEVEDHALLISPNADVGIAKADQPDPVAVGSNLTYTIVVTNIGPSTASAIALTDLLPSGVAFVSYTSSQGTCMNAASIVTCNLASLPAAGSATVSIVVTSSAPAMITNTVTVTAAEPDPNLANNSALAVTAVLAPPVVTVPPASLSVCAGSNAVFTVTATGEPPLAFQWRHAGTNLPGETSATLTITSVSNVHAGTYDVLVANSVGSTISAPATLTLLSPATATALSGIANACPGSTANFSTTAGGTGPLSYRWTKDGVGLMGETGPALSFTVTSTSGGNYCVEVSGLCSSVTNCATLSVASVPVVTGPQNQTTPMGNGAVFSVNATGPTTPASLAFQWQSNGVSLAGATAASLAVSNVTLANNGDGYRVIVSNCAGAVTSQVALLTVTPIVGLSFDFDTPGQFTNAPYNLVGNDWQLGGGGTSGALNTTQPFGPVVPFEVSTGGVGVATGGGGLDLAFGTAQDQSYIFTPMSYDFSLPNTVLRATILTKIKVPTAGARAVQMGFITATNGDDTLGNRLQLAGINGTANMAFMSAILQSTVVNTNVPAYQLRAQWKPTAGTTATEATPSNIPTNTLTTNRWYKFTAVFSNTTAYLGANTMTVSSTLQDMGDNGITPGAVVLAMAPQLTNIVNLVTTNRWYFAIRCAAETGGQDYWDNINVTTRPGPLQLVGPGVGNRTVTQGGNAGFQAWVDGDGPYTYQWYRNGVPIAGAGNWKYRTPALKYPNDDGARYSVTVTGPGVGNSVSSTGVVTVVAADLALLSVGSVEGSVIGARFSQPLEAASASVAANYLINGTPALVAQVLVNDGLQQYRTNEVLLTPAAPVSGVFTVSVVNVKSHSLTTIGAQNSAVGQVLGLTGLDIDPQSIGQNLRPQTLPGWEYSFAPGQVTVNAGGHDIFDFWDGFRFTYKAVTGDFDLKVRIAYQDMVRVPAKAGFDARLSLDPASPHVGAYANPAAPGRDFIEGGARAVWNQATASWGNQRALFYPDVWLRFRRVGNTFIRYASTNGVQWNCDGQVQSTGAGVLVPETLYVGLANNCNVGAVAGTANSAQQYKLSQFDNYGDFTGYAGAVITNLSGPSNITVNAGSAATFTNTSTLGISGVLYPLAGELVYLWQRTNTAAGGWTNMPTAGQTNAVLNTGALWATDNGAMFRVILMAPGAQNVTSAVAVVTVNDTTAPTVASSFAAPLGPNQLVLNFSEFLDAASALNAANYLVTNGFGVQVLVTGVSFMNGDPRVVVLTVASPLVGGTNFVRVSGVRDVGNQLINSTLLAVVQSGAPTSASGAELQGPVVMEFYPHMPSFGGIGDVVNRGNYRRNLSGAELTLPNGAPDFVMYSNVFGIHPHTTSFPNPGWGENYGARFYSYFRPTTTTAYKFYTRLDDFGEFWINTNAVNSTLPPDLVIGLDTNSPVAQQAWMCMDGIKTNYGNSKYLNFTAAGVNSGFYVFPAAGNTVINGMRFWAAGDAPERDPLTFQLAGTTSLSTNGPWTVVVASGNTGLPNTGGAGTGRYLPGPDATFANATAYRGYRVLFPTIRGAGQNSMQIGEVEFLNVTATATNKVLPSGAFLAVQTTGNNGNYTAGQSSSNMTLNAGQLYYMELRFKETGGGDGGAVAVRTDATLPAGPEVISNQFLVFPTNLAPVAPVQVEIYSALATLNPLTGAGGWNASGNGSILDLFNALTLTNYIAKIPNIVGYVPHFGWNTNFQSGAVTMDNYLGRIYANYIPPSTGLYKFYVAVDDTAQLLMNTNAVNSTDPAGAKLLGQIINYSGTANQNIGSFVQVQGSSGIYNLLAQNVSLLGGQPYYIEARWREGGGGDGIRVAVRAQSDASAPTGGPGLGADVIPASRLQMSSSLQRFGPIKLGGIMASVNGSPGVVTNMLVLNQGDVVTYNAVDVSGAGSYQGSIANAGITTTTVAGPGTFAANPLSTMGLIWLRNGFDLAKNQLFNSQMYYVSQPVTLADAGTLSLIVSNTFSTATQTVSIVVNPDNAPPFITFANSSPYGDTVTLLFNEPVDPLTSQCVPNYRIAGLQILWAKRDEVNRRRVVLGTSRQTPSASYTVVANGVRDGAGNPTVNAMATFTAWGSGGSGAVYVELYTNVAFGAIDQFLQTSPKFLYNMPDITYYTNNFGVGTLGADSGLNFYGARVSGLFMPPSNGLYRFYVRGDDATQLYINTNGPDPAGRSFLARNDGAGSGAYNNGNGLGGDNTRIGASQTPILSLTNGTPYWVEAVMMEGTGSDYMQVVMTAIDPGSQTDIGGVPAVAVGAALSGGFFSAPGNPDLNKLLFLSSPPANQLLGENDLANLTVLPSIVPPALSAYAAFQWQRSNGLGGFTNVPGGNVPALPNYYARLSDDNATFRFLASIPGTNAVLMTTLHVTQDVTAPFITMASSLNSSNIDLCFNEPLEFNSADDDFNYTVNGGLNGILSAIVRPDGKSITLTIDPPLGGPGTAFTVQADNIIDLAATPLSGSSVTNGVVQGFTPLSIGAAGVLGVGGYNPAPGDYSFSCAPGSIDVSANGWDIWNGADGFHFTSRQVSGNFDIKARVQRLVGADQWSKAGLMARGSLASSSRFIMMLATPPTTPIVGQAPNNFFSFQFRDADGASAAPALGNINSPPPVGYPNGWVRLQRLGSVFNGYYSSNGVDWVLLSSRDTVANTGGAFPDTLEVGLATVSHNQPSLANNAFAEYRELYFPPAPMITQQPGPSLVVTGIHKSVTFAGVVVTGPGPITYTWRKDGAAIPGANSPGLSFPNTQVSDTGVYTLLVANDGGGVISSTCTLIVTNALPVAGTDMFMGTQNVALTFNASALLGNDSDLEGDGLSLLAVSGVAPLTYSANFDDGLVPTNSSVTGVAGGGLVAGSGGVNNSGYLKLTDGVSPGSAAGAMVINELTPGRRVSAFSASFMLRIGDGSAQPADGFNFSFGSDLPSAAGTGFGENGAGTGFSFCVDNYQFVPLNIGAAANNPGGGTANTSGMKLQYNNIIITGVQMPTWNTPRFVPVTINVTADGVATVLVDGTNVFGNVTLPGYTARRGRFGLYGRTGGQWQSHWVDDLSITLNTLDTSRDILPPNLGGATLQANAYVEGTTGVGGSGALHLTDAANNQFGGYVLPELTPGQGVASFTASFGLRIGNGTGNAADGFSFNLAGDLPNPLVYGAFEEGVGTGLSLCIDNYPTGGPDSPSFKLKLGGVQLGLVLIPKWSSTAYIPVNITLSSANQLTVNVNGTNVVANLTLPYTPITGRFGLFARTGGENQTHWVDNLVINATAVNNSPGSYNANFDSGTYGTVTLTNGVITYTPPSDLCGPDAFYYIVSDGQAGGTSIGRVDVVNKETNPTPPSILSCPNTTLALPAGQCQLPLPDLSSQLVVTDNCCCVTFLQSPPAGTMLGKGSVGITFVVTDSMGLSATCMATVTVADVTPPAIVCSTNITALCTGPSGTVVNYSVNATDCDPTLTLNCLPASGSTFAIGSTLVTCTASDMSGNTTNCTFSVNVVVASANYAENVMVPDNDANGLARTRTFSSPIGIITDLNVTLQLSGGFNGDLYAYLVHDTGFSVLLNRPGRRASDSLGYGDAGFDVRLDDQATNGDIHNYRLTLFGTHNMALAGPLTNSWAPDGRAADPAMVLDTSARTAFLSSFNGLNPNGEWTLHIADISPLNTATLVSWGLEVCGLPPIPASITQSPQSQVANCGSTVNFSITATGTGPLTNSWYHNNVLIPGATGTTLTLPGVSLNSAGTYYAVSRNMGGSSTSAPAMLTVTDLPPSILCPGPVMVECTGPGGTVGTYSVTVMDDCSPGIVPVCMPPSGSAFQSGATMVTCTATDAATNVSTCSFTVNVVDTTKPALCVNPASTNLVGSVDNFAGPEPATPSVNLRTRLTGLDLRGFDDALTDAWFGHTVSNLSMFAADVTLRIRMRTVAGMPQNDTIILGFAGPGGALRPEQWSRYLGFVSGVDNGLFGGSPWSNATNEFVLNLGALPNRTGPATDLVGAIRRYGYLDIMVQDDTAIDFIKLEVRSCQCRPDIVQPVATGFCGATVNFQTPVFTDVCDTNVPAACSPPSGTLFSIGSTLVVCTATDDSGNRGTCAFSVTVTEPPPALSVSRQGSNLVICWPVTCAPYLLEQTSVLSNPGPSTWTPVATSPVVNGNQYCLTLPIQPGNKFFRLRRN